ncbi:MAG TPA: hypothetical protein VFQ37_05735, partial [Mycobacterium sp.]|nr:hypothetical protein [Mycobacterium sp.]
AVHPLASRALFGLPAAELSDLAGIAADTGYCDQAHLTREFVRFAGVPPRAWLAEEFHSIHEGAYAHSVLAGQQK